ncbi:MAG: hypothetical protein ACFFEE_11945 [Candidatus Thorarchaeota archaeon]
MSGDDRLQTALELCGFNTDRQESRLINLLTTILRMSKTPPEPLTFAEIYDALHMENPDLKLTKAWVHRILKSLVDAQLIRVESPSAHRKKYIADVNTVMAGLEQLKGTRIEELEAQSDEIKHTLEEINSLDCGELAQQFVKSITGTHQKVSSRIVRGVEELHRVLRYNMLDIAKKGDVIRATVLWLTPLVNESAINRTQKFIEAAMRGAEVRYMFSTDAVIAEGLGDGVINFEDARGMLQHVGKLIQEGVKFDIRFYDGIRTYQQVSLNSDNMALVISENPLTATWITRDFNPDLIDNAVKAFDREWRKAKSFFRMTPEDMQALGAAPGGLISRLVGSAEEDIS